MAYARDPSNFRGAWAGSKVAEKRVVCGLEENREQTQWRAMDHPEAKLEAREACRPPELCN